MGRRPVVAEQILRAMLEAPTEDRYGLELMDMTGVRSGSLYPALSTLEERGWLTSTWEVVDAAEAGRPRRRLYRLTAPGLRHAIELDREGSTLGAGIPRLAFGGQA